MGRALHPIQGIALALVVTGTVLAVPAVAGSVGPAVDTDPSAANVSVANVTAPETVPTGGEYGIVLELESGADAPVEVAVAYRRNGSVVANRTVTVPPNGTTVSLNLTAPSSPGTIEHRIAVGNESWSGTTRVRESPEFVVRAVGNLGSGAVGVSDDQPITVGGEVVNRGGVEGTRTVVVIVDGERVATENVTLGPGEGATVSTRVVPPDVERYGSMAVTVRIGNRTWSDGVSIESTPSPTPTPTSTPRTSDGHGSGGFTVGTDKRTTGNGGSRGMPGFGVAGGILALVVVVLGIRREY